MKTGSYIDFAGRRIVVSGATSGIGEAIAVALSRCNATIILIGRNSDKLDQSAEKLDTAKFEKVCIDLSDTESIGPKIRELTKKTGPLYGLCHAAGIVATQPLNAFRKSKLQLMMDINVTAGIELTKAICRRDVIDKESGAVLFISSIYGNVGMPGQIGYSATKGAVSAVARTMAIELARRNIRVNTLSPGLVKTPMTDASLAQIPKGHVKILEDSHPLGTGLPEDVAHGAVFLLAPESKWITGIDLVVDGGYTAV